jgi:hypothetical protein
MLAGYSIFRDATVTPRQFTVGGGRWEVVLSPQEAMLLKIASTPKPE